MVFALRGPGGLEIDVPGKIDSVHESLRATFTDLPDAPLTKFIMTLYGGKQGLIQNEKNICNFPQFANARMIGQNNTGEALKPLLETRCPKKAKPAGHGKSKHHKRGGKSLIRPLRRRRATVLVSGALALLTVALLAPAGYTEVKQGSDVRVIFKGKLTPRSLPRTGIAPVRVAVGATIVPARRHDAPAAAQDLDRNQPPRPLRAPGPAGLPL